MVGSVARNPHTGSRSEILADYLFSSWGTVTPARRQDDHGIDLYCALTEPLGKLAKVTDYYSVQVKSNSLAWRFKTADEMRWLIEYPLPLFLACVNKKEHEVSVYHTMARYFAPFYPLPQRLVLMPSRGILGESVQWKGGEEYSLSAPIIRASLEDFHDEQKLARLRNVLRQWIEFDTHNGILRRLGILRFRMPHKYSTNELVPEGGFVEQGMTLPTDSQLTRAIAALFEVVDCVGDQLKTRGDPAGALYAALLVRYLRTSRETEFANDPRWRREVSSSVEMNISLALNQMLPAGTLLTYMFQELDGVTRSIGEIPRVSAYLNNSKATGEKQL